VGGVLFGLGYLVGGEKGYMDGYEDGQWDAVDGME